MQPTVFNVYCDESNHLEHDHGRAMVLGAVWCDAARSREIANDLRRLKRSHGLPGAFEAKWTKISPGKLDFYLDLLRYFFTQRTLHFRGIVVPHTVVLRHREFGQSHSDFYYKMYFEMLKVIIDPRHRYRIYIDVRDTLGAERVRKLHEVLCSSKYDFDKKIIERVQQVRSHEIEQNQLADLLIGSLGYLHTGLNTSKAKLAFTDEFKRLSGYSLDKTTLYRESKVNLLIWNPQEQRQ